MGYGPNALSYTVQAVPEPEACPVSFAGASSLNCRLVHAVFAQHLNTSATLQAWAMQPRGAKGCSASKISLMEPTQASLRCGSKPSRNLRAPTLSSGRT